MTIKQIRLFGDPVLREPAAPVETFDKELRILVRDLMDTMENSPGQGLSAPQIGVSLRVFTYAIDDEIGHLINPDLALSEDIAIMSEGCLSLPGLKFDTERSYSLVAKGMNMHGEPLVIAGSDVLARCVQHETDHLDGIIFIDRLAPRARVEALRLIRETEWYGEPAPTIQISPH